MNYLLDTNIFIDFYRGGQKAKDFLQNLPERSCSVITAAELIQGARNKRELLTIKRQFLNLNLVNLSPSIGNVMLNIMEKHHLPHGLQIPDALLAATAIEEKLALVTANTKHFSFIKGLKLLNWKTLH